MQKSQERIVLEEEIRNAHESSIQIAVQMLNDEFSGDIGTAIADQSFVERMQARVKEFGDIYRKGYRVLEDLETREGYPAMHSYADLLDTISKNLPTENKSICHYVFSGVDFYWARIFEKLVCEDISFDQKEQIPQMWWDIETYGAKRRAEIISTLRSQVIIPTSSRLEFLTGDAEISREDNQYNNQQSTLLVKGGHNVLNFVETRFNDEPLQYGAIITAKSFNPLIDMEERFSKKGYRLHFSINGDDFLVPYSSFNLKDIHIFLRG